MCVVDAPTFVPLSLTPFPVHERQRQRAVSSGDRGPSDGDVGPRGDDEPGAGGDKRCATEWMEGRARTR